MLSHVDQNDCSNTAVFNYKLIDIKRVVVNRDRSRLECLRPASCDERETSDSQQALIPMQQTREHS